MRAILLCLGIVTTANAVEVPAPVLRYTFDAPFGYLEPNAMGPNYPA